jgi:hypothetical protein
MPKFTRKVKRQLYVALDLVQRDKAVLEMIETIKFKDGIEAKKKDQDKVWNENIKQAEESI